MSVTSLAFLAFCAGLILLYFLLPKKIQWVVLLVFSLAFYLICDIGGIAFMLLTAFSVYGAVRLMDALSQKRDTALKDGKETMSREERTALKTVFKKRRKRILIGTVLLNTAFLCVFKYADFAAEQFNSILSLFGSFRVREEFNLIKPLGISFYTFQSIGYLADVYWENTKPEKNCLKSLLFVSFFPQIIQGPISDFDSLSAELFSEHAFSYERFSSGCRRLIWGMFKKLVVADALNVWVADVFANYPQYAGPAVFVGAVCYAVQIYADFSGYMDIMCGLCEILGIRLTENFERPYFSKSVAEYWRRWHISLGTWFKKYVYYPIAVAKWNRKLGKSAGKKLGKHFGETLPATLALIVVWLATGLWHGASRAYVVWGLANGFFIILSLWLEPVYGKVRAALHIKEKSRAWAAFCVLRTFLLMTLIKTLPEVGTLSDGIGFWKHIFSDFTFPATFADWFPYGCRLREVIAMGVWMAAILTVDLLDRGKPVHRRISDASPAVHYVLCFAMLAAILIFGQYGRGYNPVDFMYFRF